MAKIRMDHLGNILPSGIVFRKERYKAMVFVGKKIYTKVRLTRKLTDSALEELKKEHPDFTHSHIGKIQVGYRAQVVAHNPDGTWVRKYTDVTSFAKAVAELERLKRVHDTLDRRQFENKGLFHG